MYSDYSTHPAPYCARAAHWPIHPDSITKTLNIDRPGFLNPSASQASDSGNRSCEPFLELKSRARSTCIILHGDITHRPLYTLLSVIPESFVSTCGHHLNLISSDEISPFLLYLQHITPYTVRRWCKCFPSFLFRYCQSIPVPATAISIPAASSYHRLPCQRIPEPESLGLPTSCCRFS